MSTGNGTWVSAPGRFILFGVHAMSLGGPGIAVAIEQRARCAAESAARFSVGEEDLDQSKHPFIRAAVLQGWTDMDRPLRFTLENPVPQGLGADTASLVACLGAMSMLHDHIIFETLARNAFNAEMEISSGTCPLDTGVSTMGGCVHVDVESENDSQWNMRGGNVDWHVGHLEMPKAEFVLALPRPHPDGPELANKVRRYCERNSFARDILTDIGRTARDARAALEDHDLRRVGQLMNQSQRWLVNLGASYPAADRLISTLSRYSLGAKLSGTHGWVVALTEEPEKAVRAAESAGGDVLRVKVAERGVSPDD